MSDESELAQIPQEVKAIKLLLIAMVIKQGTQQDNIKILSGVGFQPKKIAEILGTTANTVRVFLSKLRKQQKS